VALTSVEAFHRPENDAALIALLEKYQDSALIVAGGTFLHGLVSRGLLVGIEALIDIQKLGLDTINSGAESVDIGAMTRFAQLNAVPEIQDQAWLGAVKDAMAYPPAQIMNAATVGGCVASSCPFFDVPVSFLALDATVQARGPDGDRSIPISEFFPGLFDNALAANEFVAGLSLPRQDANTTSAFIKMETNANDLAILNVAVRISTDGAGRCANARVFVGGGVGETPVAAPSAEQILNGAPLNDETFAAAGAAARNDVEPMSDHRASADYRRAMTKVLLERALGRAVARLR
jgi:carbon-monoxide dehydrogenase medium subunit